MHNHVIRAVIASIAFFIPPTISVAQETLHVPPIEEPVSGAARGFPADAMPSVNVTKDEMSSFALSRRALSTQFKDVSSRTRGATDITVFRRASPYVVWVQTENGVGAGSLLKDGLILTNLHVVGDERRVVVVFKPTLGNKPGADEFVQADVIKVNRQRDLALLRPKSIPPRPFDPLEISSEDTIDVGADVNAIGHPNGEAWTYTKGIVSQVRPDYEWKGDSGLPHRAAVIQTQTPINPGNSGGPLLSGDGKIVGVNTFMRPGAQNLNFAIAAKEIRFFLETPGDDLQAKDACDGLKLLYEGRDKPNTAFIKKWSAYCDDVADLIKVIPDDKTLPIYVLVKTDRGHSKEGFDGIVYSIGRTGKWNLSYWDKDLDGTFAQKGIHPNGKLFPDKYEDRCPQGTRPIKNLDCRRT